MKVFLLIGQSNMAGRGEFGEVPDIADKRCRMLRNGRFQPMTEPIHFDRPIRGTFHSGVGLSASFAHAAAEYFGEEIGLVPCADGGTSLSDWAVGGLLYDNAVMQTKLAMRSGTLAGILWHQGEAESGSMERASSYAERFAPIMGQLRRDIGTDAPLVTGELGDYLKDYKNGAAAYYAVVNEQLHTYAASHPGTAVVSAVGLAPKPDGLHFCSAALREFGLRYFEAYRSLL
ncbi:MAG: sialate O-acetylesterase [Eubacteriales bacterium]